MKIDQKSTRNWLINEVKKVIELASERCHNKHVQKDDKLKWARCVGYNAQVLNSILRDMELEEVKRRVEVLENAK